ncbi:hypothetical protein [Sphingobacterium yanglingense]|uniref:Uncharacterized protein n=1 Tax=Sphingobacterium yanglingense TaxID=1437280 RepID=A0A4V3DE41_9SPHI|nr:hypothetical protein [Sphingobacterium yanglingense]TDQ79599.1 hypothetical protein CLV99_1044 [Sphingobacterium yanglingense]
MKPLEIRCRNKVMFAKLEIKDKYRGCTDYTLTHKNGFTIYVFRDTMGTWEHVYGELAEDIREAIIDALILRFTKPTKMFYFKGERIVVDVSFANGSGQWFVNGNKFYLGNISFHVPYGANEGEFRYNIHNPAEWLTDSLMKEFISMIERGLIDWPLDYRPSVGRFSQSKR